MIFRSFPKALHLNCYHLLFTDTGFPCFDPCSMLSSLFVGWPSIIISILLTPFALLWSKLIAFPVWLDLIYKHKPFYVLRSSYKYPNEEDFVRKNVYTGAVQHSLFPPMVDALNGFNFHADVEGGKWVESFYGFIHCLDMTTHDDRMVLETNFMTVFPGKYHPSILYHD